MSEKKIAVITGASSGIGLAIAKTLADENYDVINADIRPGTKHQGITNITCDITNGEEIDRLYSHVKDHFGIPNVLISNAGQGIHEKLSEGDPEKWKRVIDINVMGPLRLIRAFLPEMTAQNSGDIIFISSTAAEHPYEYGGVYSASKAALNMVGRTLEIEVAGKLRVSIISPGVVDSSFFLNMTGSDHTVEDIGLGSLSTQQIADQVLYQLNLPHNIHISSLTFKPVNQTL